MIPSLEDILKMLVNGHCTQEVALEWIEEIYGLKQRRDDIAIEAMNGLICADPNDNLSASAIAGLSYDIADAMIEESNK